jgi:hypothetical protein
MTKRPFFRDDVAEYRRQKGRFDLDQKRAARGHGFILSLTSFIPNCSGFADWIFQRIP